VTETKQTVVGSSAGCEWTVRSSSLVPGLGSNIVLGLQTPPAPRQALYEQFEAQPALDFRPTEVDGIPAVVGVGPGSEVQVDVGPVLVSIAALSTVDAARDHTAAEQAASDAVGVLCRKVVCQR
jgi:hypothetical protein